ncbi:MFS transporter [Actinocrispum sp. NPDC049592]|uniref:MFS transporter n=1 Tax=Actinocrispum sp. NPDC049592 TaxID=3154835 RepID=UPI00341A9B96
MTRAALPLRHNRNYRWLWLGQAVSLLGDEVLETAVMLWLGLVAAGGDSWGPAAASGVLAARTVPVLLVGPMGGVCSDRWDRRRIMLTTDAIRGTLVTGLAILLLAGEDLPVAIRLAAIYGVVALCAIAAQFFNPARYGLLATVVADEDRERMGSLTAGTAAMATIVGPTVAAGLLVVADVQWALLATAATFVVSFLAVSRVHASRVDSGRRSSTSVWRELRDGLTFFAGNQLLRVMLVTTVMVVVGVTALNTLDIFFVTTNLRAPPEVYGLLGTAFGIGSLIGAALSAVFAPRLKARRVYSCGFILVGMLLMLYSRMTGPIGALIVVFFVGFPVAAVNSMVGPLIMRAAPDHLIGRVSGVLQPAIHLASLTSAGLTAWLASVALRDLNTTVLGVHFGPIDTIFLFAGIVVALTGVWAARVLR